MLADADREAVRKYLKRDVPPGRCGFGHTAMIQFGRERVDTVGVAAAERDGQFLGSVPLREVLGDELGDEPAGDPGRSSHGDVVRSVSVRHGLSLHL